MTLSGEGGGGVFKPHATVPLCFDVRDLRCSRFKPILILNLKLNILTFSD